LLMDKEMAIRNSPVACDPAKFCSLLIATGIAETAEFKDQGRGLYNNWKSKATSIELLEIPGLNHYSILDSLVDENTLLHKSIIKLMGK